MDSTGLIQAFRLFFTFATAGDLVFVYAAIFDRDLARRVSVWFFSTLSGQPVTIHRPATQEPVSRLRWLGFALVSAIPPAAWVALELFVAKRAA